MAAFGRGILGNGDLLKNLTAAFEANDIDMMLSLLQDKNGMAFVRMLASTDDQHPLQITTKNDAISYLQSFDSIILHKDMSEQEILRIKIAKRLLASDEEWLTWSIGYMLKYFKITALFITLVVQLGLAYVFTGKMPHITDWVATITRFSFIMMGFKYVNPSFDNEIRSRGDQAINHRLIDNYTGGNFALPNLIGMAVVIILLMCLCVWVFADDVAKNKTCSSCHPLRSW